MSVGRNDPCPCGSGKKYKKCCENHSVAQTPRHVSPPKARINKEVEFAELINRAAELRLQNKLQESMALFDKAERLKIQSEVFYYNRGMLYYSMYRQDKMQQDFANALKLAPNHVEMLQKMAIPHIHLGEYPQAITLLNKAIKLNPSHAASWLWLARTYFAHGEDAKAYEALKTGHSHCPEDDPLTIAYHLFLPQLPSAKAVMLEERSRFMCGVEALMKRDITIHEPEKNIQFLPNTAAYHGMNDKELRSQYAELMLKLCPSLAYTAPHVALPVDVAARPIRIGIVSEEMQANATRQFVDNIFKVLKQRPEFELFLFTNAPLQPADKEQLKDVVDHGVLIGPSLAQARHTIANAKMDILVYLELGVRHMSYFLAFARLAKYQCAWVGLPVTTGIPAMDYYMLPSSDDTPQLQDHFTESPLFFDDIVAVFDRVSIEGEGKTKVDYGMEEGEVKNYMCPVLLYKLHPDMDEIFARILQQDPKAHIILFDAKLPKLQEALIARLHVSVPLEHFERIRFIPHLTKTQFVHAMTLADAVLDCVYFSFGTTAYLAMSGNVPFVTYPGEFAYRGVGSKLYENIGLSELIVDSLDDYVALAIKLANDASFHQRMVQHMEAYSDKVFGDHGIAEQVADKFKALVASHSLRDAG